MSVGLAIGSPLIGARRSGSAHGFWLPPHGRRPCRDRPRARAADPAPLHRPGHLPPRVRGGGPARQSRERDDHARVPRPRSSATCRSTPPLPAQCGNGMPLLEAIEQRASSQGIAVDSRVARGTHLPRRAAQTARRGAVRPDHRLRHREPRHRAERRRPRVAARARPGGGDDPPPGPGRHPADLGRGGRRPLLGRQGSLTGLLGAGTRRRPSRVVSVRTRIADPVARAGSERRCPVVGVGQSAAVQRKTAAPDAFGESGLQSLKLGDPLIDSRRPACRKPCPIASARRPVGGQLLKLRGDLIQGQPDVLGEDDERDASQHVSPEAAMPRARAFGLDQASLVVEPKCRGGNAAASRNLADGEQL